MAEAGTIAENRQMACLADDVCNPAKSKKNSKQKCPSCPKCPEVHEDEGEL